jgi:hypothetical protein
MMPWISCNEAVLGREITAENTVMSGIMIQRPRIVVVQCVLNPIKRAVYYSYLSTWRLLNIRHKITYQRLVFKVF